MEEASKRMTGSEVRAIFSEAQRKLAEMPRPPLTMEMVRKQQATMKSMPCPPGTNSRAGTKRLAVTEGEPEGWAHILLRDDVSWEEFPIFAGELLARLSGKVRSRADLTDARMWQVEVAGGVLALIYEDHPQSVLLEASSPEGVELLRELLPVLEGAMIFDNERPVPKPEALAVLAGGDGERICRVLVAVAFYERDRDWAEALMLDASRHGNEQVAGLALVCIGHLARIHGRVSPAALHRVQEGRLIPALAGSAGDAWDDIRMYAPGSLSAAGGKCEEAKDER